ncbi:hypothetical protein [Nocardioides sp. Soil805]|uniref:hypothetical protein n=1 Tax=Nocardioides sp. Soil805 TaxID=1736416 RepID=UPI000703B846|nr:hypothetical protein [Nocardioides sp. Soil805]KRF36262.1 hypothetical protein ASG94_01960 [Nocardioides sp. Soil805]
MARARGTEVAHALRALAAPASVLALVVLVLNDHVLKQAYPGILTGKLSDVVGLVVAPLLLAVLLAALGLRHPAPTATILTGVGFVVAKTSATGAAATSAAWSLSGVPTLIRPDVTDLLALPALGVAWWVDRQVRRSPALPWRRVVAVGSGMAVLPVAVLATAATGCAEGMALTSASRVEGDFPGRPRRVEQRLTIGEHSSISYTIDATRTIERPEVQLSSAERSGLQQCDPTEPEMCWRILDDGVTVEHSVDGGRDWEPELDLTQDQVEALVEEVGDDCGDEAHVAAFDLALLPTDGEPVLVVPIGQAGVYLRGEDAAWVRYSIPELYDLVATSTIEPPRPRVTPLDQPQEEREPGEPDPTDEQTPTCARPTPTTVTPHPSNGPPTTYDVCP